MKTINPKTITACLALLLLTASVFSQTVKKTVAPVKKTTASTTKKPVVSQKKPAGTTASSQRVVKDSSATTTAKTTTTTAAKENTATTTAKTTPVEATKTTSTTTQSTATKVSQVQTTKAPPLVYQDPFKKGTFSFINKKNIDFSSFKTFPEINTVPTLDVDLDFNYFIIDHFAVGVKLDYYTYKQKQTPKSSYRYYEAYLNLTYGRSISPRVGIYGRIGYGLGSSKSVTLQNTLNANYKDYYGSIAAPIAIEPGNPVFITPYFNYSVAKTKAGNHDITEKGFQIGVRFESYLTSGIIKTGKPASGGLPKEGVSFIEFATGAGYSKSTRKEYQGTIRFGDVKKNSQNLSIGYHRYFLDYLAGGLNLNYRRSSSFNGSPDVSKYFSIQPTVTVHPPVAGPLHNAFLQVGYGFEKGNYNGSKEDNSFLMTRLGYNLFLTKNISLSPKIGYQRNRDNHHSSGGDRISTEKGIQSEIGIGAWFK